MTSFSRHLVVPAALGLGLVSTVCLGGNQELVERKTSELRSINEQVVKQAVPGGLKEGETVEVKATLRVERSAEKGAVARDVQVERVKVSAEPVPVPAKAVVPIVGAGKIREGDAARPAGEGISGFRQEQLNVPVPKSAPPPIKVQPLEEEKSVPPPVVVNEEKPSAEGTPGFRQERLNVPPVNEKRKE